MQIEEVQQYQWSSYGPYAFFVDIVIPLELGSAQLIMDLAHNRICEMTVCDYTQPKNKQAYLWRNPLFRQAHDAEARWRGYTKKQMSYAWDKTPWVNVPPAQIFKRLRELVARAKKKNPPK